MNTLYNNFVNNLRQTHDILMDDEFDYLLGISGFVEYFEEFESYDLELDWLKLFETKDFNNILTELPKGFYSHQGFAPSVSLSDPRFGFN